MKKVLAIVLAMVMVVCFASCGQKEEAKDYSKSVEGAYVVAESGSAGEELVKGDEFFKNIKEFTPVDSMTNALMDVNSKTADVALVDYVASIGSIGEGTDFVDLKVVEGKDFNPEQYGIAFRKGSDITPAVNAAIKELMADGTMDAIAAKYKLGDILIKDGEATSTEVQEGDLAYVKSNGKLIIGITLFAPMNYKDDSGELIGFETEFAKAVCEKLGLEAEFQVINWSAKETELAAKNIDCIWNGMTITDERAENMSISVPYMQNKQVMVVKSK